MQNCRSAACVVVVLATLERLLLLALFVELGSFICRVGKPARGAVIPLVSLVSRVQFAVARVCGGDAS